MTTPAMDESEAPSPGVASRPEARTPGVVVHRRGSGPVRTAALVGLVGGVVTGCLSWAAWSLDRHNERNLLTVQTRQAAAVLTSAILTISDPLGAALDIAQATDGDVEQFRQALGSRTGPGRAFASATLYRVTDTGVRTVDSVGSPAQLPPESPRGREFLRQALHSPTFVVSSTGTARIERIAYAVANPADPRFVVHAEREIPANRLVPVESNPAFANLDFATYLGPSTDLGRLATTDVPLSELPLAGDTAVESIPFGNTTVTLVAAARVPLGGPLGEQLPWILMVAGAALTTGAATVAVRSVRRRAEAERDAGTITRLYSELDELYAEQRTIAEALQHALLPRAHPAIPALDIASCYVAGAQGIDIGGDWYSVISIDDTRFGFVVGDVSGRGVSAATVMARMRFTMRAYLLEGHGPDTVLEMCSHQLDFAEDGHFATVLVGVGDVRTREVVLANAGHLEPLVLHGSKAEYVTTKVGPPLGVQPGPYASTRISMAPGSLLVAFTDGLVERRTESLDVGLARLADAAALPADSLDEFVTGLVRQLTNLQSEDDVAVLALRWRQPPPHP